MRGAAGGGGGAGATTGAGGGGRRRGGLRRQLLEAAGERAQIRERRLLRFSRDVLIRERGQHLCEPVGGGREFLSIERRLRLRVLLLDDRRQHAAANGRERRSNAGRDVAGARLKRRLGGDDRFDGLLRVSRPAERQETERAVLLDGARLARRVIRRSQPVQHCQRIVVGG